MTAASARTGAMRRALDAGVPPELLAVLMAARLQWRADNEGVQVEQQPPQDDTAAALWDEQVALALQHPKAPAYDEVFVAAARRARGLSCRS